MRQYLDLERHVLKHGVEKADRTGVGTLSVFGAQMRYDLSKGEFPLITTRKIHVRSVVEELLWFLRGETNVKSLQERGVTIWDEWADEQGELGPVYGRQWRSWPAGDRYVDQLRDIVEEIKQFPESRRLLVSAWNVSDIPKMALAPCHVLFQFYVANRKLSCQVYQRSADVFLGVPFNIASYALLTMIVAQETELELGEFVHVLGDAHIYKNHIEQVKKQLTREPRQPPRLIIPKGSIDEIAYNARYEDFELKGYDPHPAIRAPIAV